MPRTKSKGDSTNGEAQKKTRSPRVQKAEKPTKNSPASEVADQVDDEDEGWVTGKTGRGKATTWLIPGWIPNGSLTLLAGDSEAGKSCLMALLVAACTGAKGPLGKPLSRQGALVLAGEEDLASMVDPRLEAAGADLDLVTRRDPLGKDPIRFPGSFDRLRRVIEKLKPALMVVDPVTSFVPPRYSLNDEQQTRDVLGCLVELAMTCQFAVVTSRNLRKGEGSPYERIIGSVAFRNVPRTVLLAVNHPIRPDSKVLIRAKGVGPTPDPLAYKLDFRRGKVPVWTPQGKADVGLDALGPEADDPGARDEIEAAIEFIKHWVGKGWVRSADIYDAGKKEYLSERTLRRAAKQLGVQVRRTGNGEHHKSEWSAPKGGYKS